VLSDESGVTGQAIIKAILRANVIRISWLRFVILGCRRSRSRLNGVGRATGKEDLPFVLKQEQDG